MTITTIRKKYIDIKLVLLLAGFYLLFDIVLIAKVAYMQAVVLHDQYFSWGSFLIHNILLDYIIVVSYMTIIAISTKRFLNKNYSWVRIITFHTILSILIGMVIRLVLDFYTILTGQQTLAEYDFRESVYAFMFVIDLNFLIYFAMVFIVYTYYYLKQVKQAEKRHIKLESQIVNARMRMLSSQLQPHFLFNTLNSISVLTDVDAGKAKDTIADLSDFLREILYKSDSNVIILDEELRILEYYLNILHVRFSDHLNITKEIEESFRYKKVPALLLQPLIENSIKHGYSYDHTDLHINIAVFSEQKKFILKITNNGASITETHAQLMEKGVGLRNIDDRLKNLYGKDYHFEIRNRENQRGVETIIEIPL
ncbi:histidine kinase [Zunongwangia sp. F363]|uniref:Histidine kinase n=1 Tax=Autumnicola tepida TaxID=3075595 RepID=A0ABU3CCX5_9FLAO|nr:histidine kinase [Zunongwangia sp. F363]MDT0644184.1 histidine kinase [Zunongwangia sp. F363]